MNENWPEIVEDLSPCLRPGAIKGDYLRDVEYCLRYLGWKKTNGTMVFRDMWHSGGDDSGHPDILLCKKEKDGTCLPVLPVVVELPDSEPSGRLALSMRQLKLDIGKLAVDSGYWPLYRFNPELAEQGKAPLTLESKAPDGTLRDFLAGENRYAQLKSIAPQDSERLQNDLEKAYNDRYQLLKYMAAFSGSAEQPKAAEEPKVTE